GVAERAPLEHSEVRLAVAHVAVELDERARVAQALGALAREELALGALAFDRAFAAGVRRLLAQVLEPPELRLGRLVRALPFCLRHAPEPTIASWTHSTA